MLEQIPLIEFESLTYSRSGPIATTATVSATGARKEGNEIVIDNLHITESFPFMGVDIQLKKYRRVISE